MATLADLDLDILTNILNFNASAIIIKVFIQIVLRTEPYH